ncbi:hypothetical protein [Flavobacterium ranwuense]|uniref:hypothetical protein n=1 Tax=Flavobacterium ranwuense TaxID=2541725 RepID=UPI00197ABA47|nr:hypothetical protein [Flavobacterium ranwuense]
MNKAIDNRIPALIRFASAITLLNIVGHLYLGFEQSYSHVAVALGTAYFVELLMETLVARNENRKPTYLGGIKNLILFLLPGHISALAVGMLTFTNTNLLLVSFGVAAALLSKYIFRIKINGKNKHFLNPSNTGIVALFVLFPSVGSAPPYQFSEATSGYWDWFLILVFVSLGSFLNTKFTKKMPLIFAWLIGFFLQTVIRTTIFDTATIASLGTMSGVAFLLFTFYMVSDPATTPFKFKNQIYFGAGVAFTYGILMAFHVVFGLFFSLFTVCSIRGVYLWITNMQKQEIKETINKDIDSNNGEMRKEVIYTEEIPKILENNY